jgi:hypothetical protein
VGKEQGQWICVWSCDVWGSNRAGVCACEAVMCGEGAKL